MRRRHQGFSLLELLVAFSIMAVSLALLYRMMGSSVRNVADAEQYQRAIVLAESLLSARTAVDPGGWNESGESAGLQWAAHSEPYVTPLANSSPSAVALFKIDLVVQWSDGERPRRLELSTLRPQRKIMPQAGIK
ncbi:MAG: type II secretion system protein [Hylemonella sp.]|nr:type II secretion system protein [Hylemonella sp.]